MWSLKKASVYSLSDLPGEVRPARPERCEADAVEVGTTVRISIPVEIHYHELTISLR